MLLRSLNWLRLCFFAILVTRSCALKAQHPGGALKQSPHELTSLKVSMRKLNLYDWRLASFEDFGKDQQSTAPWTQFIQFRIGSAILFKNASLSIDNIGKGGNARGRRHPEFTLWFFPRLGLADTPAAMETEFSKRHNLQESIPSVIASNDRFIVSCVGDCDFGLTPIVRVFQAFNLKPTEPIE